MIPTLTHSLSALNLPLARRGDRGHRRRPARGRRAGRRPAPAGEELARRIGRLAQDKKAEEVVLLDLRGISSETDFFVVMSSLSETHQKALCGYILEGMGAEGVKEWHVEGYPSSGWILLDYVDVVVHVFRPESRGFYALESLWGDAPRELMTESDAGPGGREE